MGSQRHPKRTHRAPESREIIQRHQICIFTNEEKPVIKFCADCNNWFPEANFYVLPESERNAATGRMHYNQCVTCYDARKKALKSQRKHHEDQALV